VEIVAIRRVLLAGHHFDGQLDIFATADSAMKARLVACQPVFELMRRRPWRRL
jgi:hypothetical protein